MSESISKPRAPAATYTHPDHGELDELLDVCRKEARRYLADINDKPVSHAGADALADSFNAPLPETGAGGLAALQRLLEGRDALVTSVGPRHFHFVVGGHTPAALAADWVTSTWDQIAGGWANSPLAVNMERIAIRWLLDLFRLPGDWGGSLVTGAMMANFTGLACARQWWGEQHGTDVAEQGLSGLPRIPVLSSGYLHATSYKALAMLGVGRASVSTFSRDPAGRVDLGALETALRDANGPAIVIANAGEVNTGDFDPVEAMAMLAKEHGAWLHVDGAFGLFARTTPKAEHLCAGTELADSVTVDAHKWLNVPYDCGISLLREPQRLGQVFPQRACYLQSTDDPRPVLSHLSPESSRRARAFPVWATLQAYGRAGVSGWVERHLELAQHLARRVDEAEDLERLADVPLNIVCFRYRPPGASADTLDDLNQRLGELILSDGRVYAGTTRYAGKTALRPALVNWRTRQEDVDFFVDVVRELGATAAR